MSSDAVFNAVRALLGDSFAATDAGGNSIDVPVIWPNSRADQGDDAPWLLVEVSDNHLSPVDFGTSTGGTFREMGQIWVHCFVPAYSGTETQRAILKQIHGLFRANNPYQFVHFFKPGSSIGMGEQGDENGRWWRLSLTVDWYYDDH